MLSTMSAKQQVELFIVQEQLAEGDTPEEEVWSDPEEVHACVETAEEEVARIEASCAHWGEGYSTTTRIVKLVGEVVAVKTHEPKDE